MVEENNTLLARFESNKKQLQATNQLVLQIMQQMNFQPTNLHPLLETKQEKSLNELTTCISYYL